jgi:hypothetical protein
MDKDTSPDRSQLRRCHSLRQIVLPLALILGVGIALSISVAKREADRQQQELENRFQATVQQTTRVLQEKVDRFTRRSLTSPVLW